MCSLPLLTVQRGSEAESRFESQAHTDRVVRILTRSVTGVTWTTVYSDAILGNTKVPRGTGNALHATDGGL